MSDREEELARYLIIDMRRPISKDLEEDIKWLARSFGFLESRDIAMTAARILSFLIHSVSKGDGLTSDELADEIGVTRGAIIHHLKKMINSGLVIYHGGRYKLRARSLRRTVEEVKRDLLRVFENIEEIAESIDNELKLPYRNM